VNNFPPVREAHAVRVKISRGLGLAQKTFCIFAGFSAKKPVGIGDAK
jgi:hypothetical protein